MMIRARVLALLSPLILVVPVGLAHAKGDCVSQSVDYYQVTSTPTPAPTVTPVPFILPPYYTSTPFSSTFECRGEPEGWGTVTPNVLWSLGCGQCVGALPTVTPLPTSSDVTPTPTSTPARAFYIVVDDSVAGITAQAGVNCVSGHCYSPVFEIRPPSYVWSELISMQIRTQQVGPSGAFFYFTGANESGAPWWPFVFSSFYGTGGPVYKDLFFYPDAISGFPCSGKTGMLKLYYLGSCSGTISGHSSYVQSAADSYNYQGAYLEAQTGGDPLRMSYYVDNISGSSFQILDIRWMYYGVGATVPQDSYCSVVRGEEGEPGFSWDGISLGAVTECLDVGPYSVSFLGWEWSLPYLAHICFAPVTFGTLTIFGRPLGMDSGFVAMGIVAILRWLRS